MPKDIKETVTPTEPIVEVDEVVETEATPQDTDEEKGGFNYVKTRVERAKRQTEESILKDLGFESLDEVKETLKINKTALDEIKELKESLAKKEKQALETRKHNAIIKLLDDNKVFDSEALAHYVDLDKVDFDDNGNITDSDGIVESLKKAKPNFFGVEVLKSDGYVKGGQTQPKTALDKQKEGDYVGAIGDYLKEILK